MVIQSLPTPKIVGANINVSPSSQHGTICNMLAPPFEKVSEKIVVPTLIFYYIPWTFTNLPGQKVGIPSTGTAPDDFCSCWIWCSLCQHGSTWSLSIPMHTRAGLFVSALVRDELKKSWQSLNATKLMGYTERFVFIPGWCAPTEDMVCMHMVQRMCCSSQTFKMKAIELVYTSNCTGIYHFLSEDRLVVVLLWIMSISCIVTSRHTIFQVPKSYSSSPPLTSCYPCVFKANINKGMTWLHCTSFCCCLVDVVVL